MTTREMLLIKSGIVILSSAMVIAVVTVFLVKFSRPEMKPDKPKHPSTQNLRSIGIALEMYADDFEGLSLPVFDEAEKREYTAPGGQ